MKGHEESIRSIAITPCGRKAISGSMDTTIRVWDLATYQELFVLRGHQSMVNSVALKSSKIAVSVSNDATLRL